MGRLRSHLKKKWGSGGIGHVVDASARDDPYQRGLSLCVFVTGTVLDIFEDRGA